MRRPRFERVLSCKCREVAGPDAVLNLLAVLFGAAVAAWLPEWLVTLAVAALFAGFGISALRYTDDDEDERQLENGGIEPLCDDDERRPVHRALAGGDHRQRGVVRENDAEQCEGDSDRTENDVFPCRLDGAFALVERDEERRRERGETPPRRL